MLRKSDVVWLAVGAFAVLVIVADWVVGRPPKPETVGSNLDETVQTNMALRHGAASGGMDPNPQVVARTAGPNPATKPDVARSSSLPGESRAVLSAGDGQHWTKAELDQDFKVFLAHQGYTGDEVERLLSSPAPARKTTKTMPAESRTDEEVAVLESLQQRYPVVDARLRANGEVWIQLDPGSAKSVTMEDMMAAAAEHGQAGHPVKVVVWSGNRTQAVRTFFGDPVF